MGEIAPIHRTAEESVILETVARAERAEARVLALETELNEIRRTLFRVSNAKNIRRTSVGLESARANMAEADAAFFADPTDANRARRDIARADLAIEFDRIER